jgi:hypothetical protein
MAVNCKRRAWWVFGHALVVPGELSAHSPPIGAAQRRTFRGFTGSWLHT